MARPDVFSSESFADAVAASKGSGKLLIVDATASWCQPCQVMDRVMWVDPKVVAFIREHATAIQLDVDHEKEVAAALRVRAMPTVIVLRAGDEVDRVIGLKKPAELLAWLDALARGETSLDQLRRASEANPADMQARHAFVRALQGSGRLDEATEGYAWLWQHMLEHDPSMVGVRCSFMLGDMENLMKEHPAARGRFTELRDTLGHDGPSPAASADELRDWLALTVALGEADVVLRWFDASGGPLLHAQPELEHTLQVRLVPLLTKQGRWADTANLFTDPLETLREHEERLEVTRCGELPAEIAELRPRMIDAEEYGLRKTAGIMAASLLAAGRETEARAVVAEVRRLLPGAETEKTLAKTAKKAGVNLP
jgi:thiol-disulfide isomerase/thioredoxin